jgi:hypothetical protein
MGSGGLRTKENINNIIAQPLDAKTECGLYVYAIELNGFAQSASQITVLPSETQIMSEAESRFFPLPIFWPLLHVMFHLYKCNYHPSRLCNPSKLVY